MTSNRRLAEEEETEKKLPARMDHAGRGPATVYVGPLGRQDAQVVSIAKHCASGAVSSITT
jgi:hypothetical protein